MKKTTNRPRELKAEYDNSSTPRSGIYENETVNELKSRLVSYRELTGLAVRDLKNLPTSHHPTGYAPPPFRPSEWQGRSWTKDDNLATIPEKKPR